MRTVVFLLFSLTAAAVFAEDVGYLYLHRHAEIAERDGAQAADLFVYTADGAPVASARGGQFPGGELVPLPPGDYFVEVGRFRAPVFGNSSGRRGSRRFGCGAGCHASQSLYDHSGRHQRLGRCARLQPDRPGDGAIDPGALSQVGFAPAK